MRKCALCNNIVEPDVPKEIKLCKNCQLDVELFELEMQSDESTCD